MKRKTIVAIGGGDIRTGNTKALDRAIVRLSGNRRPRFLFIPTASSDDVEYWNGIRRYFTKLGCRCDVLFLLREKTTASKRRAKISQADIIYVGGGNTLKMVRLWKRLGVDRLLVRAYNSGTILCGVSAGAICWFDHGHSDSMSFYHKRWKYIRVSGLGLVPGLCCPHYDSATKGVPRRKYFHEMIKQFGGTGIAIEDCCAVQFDDGKISRVISSRRGGRALRVSKVKGKIVEEKL